MVRNFDSYVYTCGFESTGTPGKLTLSFFLLSRQCLKMRVLVLMFRPKVGGIMYDLSAQPQPVKWPQFSNCSSSCLFLLS